MNQEYIFILHFKFLLNFQDFLSNQNYFIKFYEKKAKKT